MSEFTPGIEAVRGVWIQRRWEHNKTSRVQSSGEFDRWLAEYTRQQREEAWEEGYEAALWDKNPYRPETLPFNIHKWAEEVRKAND